MPQTKLHLQHLQGHDLPGGSRRGPSTSLEPVEDPLHHRPLLRPEAGQPLLHHRALSVTHYALQVSTVTRQKLRPN